MSKINTLTSLNYVTQSVKERELAFWNLRFSKLESEIFKSNPDSKKANIVNDDDDEDDDY